MPWNERLALDERKQFIEEWQEGEAISELCRRYEVSRPTAYKWIGRYEAAGETGLIVRSRAPHHRPQAMAPEVIGEILMQRGKHPTWGPKKLLALLKRLDAQTQWPALSSIGELLKREGLAHPPRRRKRTPPYFQPLQHAQAPNQLWCADFKGWFVCGDGQRCDPLTATDAYSRFLLRCRAVAKADGAHVRVLFEAMFREYGMPEAIRTDNGTPFASRAPGGLSRLSMWWMRLGIRHERIEPGCPQQNGRHERMHRTLKQETATPPRASLRQQQLAFVSFEQEYNRERPHEALDYQRPADLYVASAREYPAKLPELEYPAGCHLRRVSQQGSLKWNGQRTFLSEVLGRETVGLLESEDDFYQVYYGGLLLGQFDAVQHRFEEKRAPRRIPAKKISLRQQGI
jgi:transposase InsO family protein